MFENNELGLLFILSGPSGSGKDTVFQELLKTTDNVVETVSATSREKRENEIDGVDYYFLTDEEFKKKIEEEAFLEYVKYNNTYYGTLKSEVERIIKAGKDAFLIIEVNGAKRVKSIFPEAKLIYLIPPSVEELKNRLKKRNTDTVEQINNRIKIAAQEIFEVKNYDYKVISKNPSYAANIINGIILSEKAKITNISEEEIAEMSEKLLKILD